MTTLIKPRIKLSHNVIEVEADTICIGETPGHSYLLANVGPEYLQLLGLLNGKNTVPRIERQFQNQFPSVSKEEILSAIEDLEGRNLLEDGAAESRLLSAEEMERYDRQVLYYSVLAPSGTPGFAYQEALKAKRVAVFGMGGWGTWVAQHLALNGVGAIRIVDGDHVELSNLNRQVLYRQTDIGSCKVAAAADQIADMNPHVVVDPVPDFVPKDSARIADLVEGIDAVFLCWASLGYYLENTAEEIIHRVCFDRRIPVFEMAADPFDISAGPVYINDRRDACYCCNHSDIGKTVVGDEVANASINKARLARQFRNGDRVVNAWQTSPSLGIMAGIVADQALKLLAGLERPYLSDKKFSLNLHNLSTNLERFTRKSGCAWCSSEDLP